MIYTTKLCSFLIAVALLPTWNCLSAMQQQGNFVAIEQILNNVQQKQTYANKTIQIPWWQNHTSQSLNSQAARIEVGVNELLRLAIANSAKVSVARHVPMIRQTAVNEAVSNFDWTRFLDTMWTDSSEPIGSSLTVGSTSGEDRFRDHNWTFEAGARRRLFNGAEVSITQRLGHQDTNSTFFIPNDQATSRIILGYTQPLLRGRGEYYNTSLIILAQVDVTASAAEFDRQIQAHLLEVARAYWSLYLERASLAQRVKLYLRTKRVYDQLNERQKIDAQRTQLVSAQAAFQSREADLIRAQAAVKNAETRLRALINAPEISTENPDFIELIPADHPITWQLPTDLQTEFTQAMTNRPEIRGAMQQIRAAGVRLDIARHELLPKLNLVTQAYVAGLQGDSQLGDAWLDQFRRGEPSYSVGLQYELPVGRRGALARQSRRQLEVSQVQEEYRNALELVRAEVEVAVREVETAFKEMVAKNQAQIAAELEAQTLETRWRELADGVSAGLSLEALLRAQERVTDVEFEFAQSQLTYNLALINLRHANGSLISIVHGSDAVDSTLNAIGEVTHTVVGGPQSYPIGNGYQSAPAAGGIQPSNIIQSNGPIINQLPAMPPSSAPVSPAASLWDPPSP